MKVSDGQKLTLDDIEKEGLKCGACDSSIETKYTGEDALYRYVGYADCHKCKVQYAMYYDSVTVKAVDF